MQAAWKRDYNDIGRTAPWAASHWPVLPVDFRKGATGLMALVHDGGANPLGRALYLFRSKQAQYATFCIQSSKRDNCIFVASPSGRTLQVATRQDLKCIYIEERRGFSREVPNWTKVTVPKWRSNQPRSVLTGSTNSLLF